MASDGAVDYSQGLPTPATADGVGDFPDIEGIFKALWPVGLIAIGIVALSSLAGVAGGGLEGLGAAPRRKGRRRMTEAAQAYVRKKIRKIVGEGKPQAQAIKAAFEMARRSGYRVPPPPK